jgi:hypothetical protein
MTVTVIDPSSTIEPSNRVALSFWTLIEFFFIFFIIIIKPRHIETSYPIVKLSR